jgi:hypothetical protein
MATMLGFPKKGRKVTEFKMMGQRQDRSCLAFIICNLQIIKDAESARMPKRSCKSLQKSRNRPSPAVGGSLATVTPTGAHPYGDGFVEDLVSF